MIESGRRLETHSYVMKVIAWPGMILMSRGVRPFHSARTPSSFAISAIADANPPYLGACPGITTWGAREMFPEDRECHSMQIDEFPGHRGCHAKLIDEQWE